MNQDHQLALRRLARTLPERDEPATGHPSPPCAVGTIVADRFQVIRELSGGAMGSVWLAHDIRLDTSCALKLIHTSLAERNDIRARFEREAKTAAQLRSSHVVQILDYGVWNDLQYIAMELLEGETLQARLQRCGRLPVEQTVRIVAQVARALTKAHAAGLVHRDLTPGNIFLVPEDDDEIVKVLDFGIVKSHLPVFEGTVTQVGALIGTPLYMSPEQAQGLSQIDYRSDLWSLAVLAFRCMTGRLPFESDALGDLLLQIVLGDLPVPSAVAADVPPTFDVWWARAAVRDPNRRFQSAKDLSDALAVALGVNPIAISRNTPVTFISVASTPPAAPPNAGSAEPRPTNAARPRASAPPANDARAMGPMSTGHVGVIDVPARRSRTRWPWTVAELAAAFVVLATVAVLTLSGTLYIERAVRARSTFEPMLDAHAAALVGPDPGAAPAAMPAPARPAKPSIAP